MPVSAHPAFPIIVSLWFAALFGIGSMVLPLEMFERFTVSSGLADAYDAAQPPLGATARIVIAVAGAAIGALAGLFVARRVTAANAPRATTRRAAAMRQEADFDAETVKRPISAHEELGEGGLDAEEDEAPLRREGGLGRRRALAVTDESAPSDFLSFAPLPGRMPSEADEPLDLIAFDAGEPVADEEDVSVEQADFGSSSLSAPPSPAESVEAIDSSPVEFEPAPFTRRVEPEAEVAAIETDAAEPVVPLAERALGQLGMVELVERFALALQQHRETPAPAMAEPAFAAPEGAADAEEDAFAVPFAAFAAPAETDVPPVHTVPAALRPFGFEDEEDEAESLPDLDLTAALSQSRAPFAEPASVLAEADEPAEPEDEFEEEAEAGYTSLLAMKSPFGAPRESIRIDDEPEDEGEEPVVVFPGQAVRRAAPAGDGPARDVLAASLSAGPRPFDAPLARAEQAAAHASAPHFSATRADPGETERALREALEKLQRMSGAA